MDCIAEGEISQDWISGSGNDLGGRALHEIIISRKYYLIFAVIQLPGCANAIENHL